MLHLRFHLPTLLIGALLTASSSFAQSGPAKAYAAGSLTGALTEMIATSGLPADSVAKPVFGPAGALRQRLESGEQADLYLSANMDHPRKLVEDGRASVVIPFARNRLCVISKKGLGMTQANMLDLILAPSTRVATSTPIVDPGGDYTWAAFDRAEALRPGAKAILDAKAIRVIGSNLMTPLPGKSLAASVFLADKADVLIYYCSGAADALREAPDLVSMTLPADLDVPVAYGMALLTSNPTAQQLALFVLSEKGQAVLSHYGLIPIAQIP